jgi:hypothetical protein
LSGTAKTNYGKPDWKLTLAQRRRVAKRRNKAKGKAGKPAKP